MNNQLGEQVLTALRGFAGYGNPKSPLWFIGLEEGLGPRSPRTIKQHLEKRLQFNQTEDLAEAVRKLGVTGFHDETQPTPQKTWVWMATIAVGLEGGDWRNEEVVCAYQRDHLGRSHGCTFLTELYPLPKPRFDGWPEPYKQWFGFESAIAYRNDCRQERIRWMAELMRDKAPFVVCYGKADDRAGDWGDFRGLFPDINFGGKHPSRWRHGVGRDRTVVLAPHFSWFSRNRNEEKGRECCCQIIEFLAGRGWKPI